MRAPSRTLLWLLALVVACGDDGGGGTPDGGGANPDGAASTEEPTLEVTEVLDGGGGVIWDLAFLPDGSALYTVRSGQLRRWMPGQTSSTLVAERASAGNPFAGLLVEGQSGLMGLAVDPAFSQNRRIYLYFSHETGGTKDNRVVRYRLTDQLTLAERQDIVTGISYKAVATSNGGPGAHSGGRLRFGPDGFLYQTTGDNHNATIPQDVEALGSKVLRFRTDGTPAPGNPGLGSRNLIWAMGFRNPQGITFHPQAGEVFISEHGPNNDDEVTRLGAGANGGWNPVGPGGEYNGYTGARMTDTTAVPNAVAPVWINSDSEGMSACVFLRGTVWKAWENRLAVGFLAGNRVMVLRLDDARTSVAETDRIDGISTRVRSLVIGPDSLLYVTTDDGTILRVTPR